MQNKIKAGGAQGDEALQSTCIYTGTVGFTLLLLHTPLYTLYTPLDVPVSYLQMHPRSCWVVHSFVYACVLRARVYTCVHTSVRVFDDEYLGIDAVLACLVSRQAGIIIVIIGRCPLGVRYTEGRFRSCCHSCYLFIGVPRMIGLQYVGCGLR